MPTGLLLTIVLQLVLIATVLPARAASPIAATRPADNDNAYYHEAVRILDSVESRIDDITGTSARAAKLYVGDDSLRLGVDGAQCFVREATYRSGGIIQVDRPNRMQKDAWNGIVLYSLREGRTAEDVDRMKSYLRRRCPLVVFGTGKLLASVPLKEESLLGKVVVPETTEGTSASASDAAPRAQTYELATMATLWPWVGEFVAACTRAGKMPTMYQSIRVPGARERNDRLKDLRFHESRPRAVKSGVLARAYLQSARDRLKQLRKDQSEDIKRVARLATERKAQGKRLFMIGGAHGAAHIADGPRDPDLFTDIAQRWRDQHRNGSSGDSERVSFKPGDLLLVVGYDYVPNEGGWHNLADEARRNGATLVLCIATFRKDQMAQVRSSDILIEMPWELGDAEVELPGYDVNILPTSNVIAAATYGMINAEMLALGSDSARSVGGSTSAPARADEEPESLERWRDLNEREKVRKAMADLREESKKILARRVLPEYDGHAQLQQFVVRRAPELAVPESREAFRQWAQKTRQRFLDEVIYRGMPKEILQAKPRVRWDETIKTGKGYVIRKLAYEAYPDVWIPALLYEPEGLPRDAKRPVVLNPNGHFHEGKASPFKQIRCINLAKRGMLALNIGWLGRGQRLPEAKKDLRTAHNDLVFLDLCGRSGAGVFHLVCKRGLDVLLDHPNADPEKVVVTGLSGGGMQTLWLGALDPRVKLTVPNAGYIDIATRAMQRMASGDKEQNPADMARLGGYVTLTALLHPRPAMLIYNTKDICFKPEDARENIFEPLLDLYRRWGKPEDFTLYVNSDPGTHNYEKDNREAFYRCLGRFLGEDDPAWAKEIPSEDEVLSGKQLAVTLPVKGPVGSALWKSLSEKIVPDLPRTDEFDPDQASQWSANLREKLRELLRIRKLKALEGTRKPLETDSWYKAAEVTYKVGEDWVLPAIEFVPPEPRGTVLAVHDLGKERLAIVPWALLRARYRVVCLDLPFSGEMNARDHGRFRGWMNWQLAQLFDSLGERPMGVRVSILTAVAENLRKTTSQPVVLYSQGRATAVAGLIAIGLTPEDDALYARSLPKSLKEAIAQGRGYGSMPTFFSFGLLEAVDVPQLRRLAGEANVLSNLRGLEAPR
jgi:hypothetical protein